MDVELIVGKVENVIPYSPQTIAGIHQRLDRALEADLSETYCKKNIELYSLSQNYELSS